MPTNFKDITFDEPSHSYCIGDYRFQASASTVISRLYPAFDRDRIAQKQANKLGRSLDSVLAEWEKKGRTALDKGTLIHAYAEDLVVIGRKDPIMRSVAALYPEVKALEKVWHTLQEEHNAKFIEKEMTVGDEELGIAGRVDLIVSIDDVKHIFDWKTGKFDTRNNFGTKLLPPFEKYDDCKWNRYSLQLSLYRLIIERNTGESFGDGYIAHLKPDGMPMLYRVRDFRKELEEWLLSGVWRYDPETDKAALQIIEVLTRIDKQFLDKISEQTSFKLHAALTRACEACMQKPENEPE